MTVKAATSKTERHLNRFVSFEVAAIWHAGISSRRRG